MPRANARPTCHFELDVNERANRLGGDDVEHVRLPHGKKAKKD